MFWGEFHRRFTGKVSRETPGIPINFWLKKGGTQLLTTVSKLPNFFKKKKKKETKTKLALTFPSTSNPLQKNEQLQIAYVPTKKMVQYTIYTLFRESSKKVLACFSPKRRPKLLQGFRGQFCRCVGFCPFTGSQQCIRRTVEVVGRLERLQLQRHRCREGFGNRIAKSLGWKFLDFFVMFKVFPKIIGKKVEKKTLTSTEMIFSENSSSHNHGSKNGTLEIELQKSQQAGEKTITSTQTDCWKKNIAKPPGIFWTVLDILTIYLLNGKWAWM